MATDLVDLETLEVSLVKRGANKKRFALAKNEGSEMKDLTAAILAAPGDIDPQLAEVLKEALSKEAEAVIADAFKMLSAVKDEMSGELFAKISEALGFGKAEEEPEEEPEAAAEEPAEAAAEDEPEEEAEKSIEKSADPEVVALFKEHEELKALYKAELAEKRTKEFIAKAEEQFANIPGATCEAVGHLLRDLHDLDQGIADRVESVLKGTQALVENVGVLGESGTRAQAPASGDADARLDTMARARVEKTGISYAKAYESVLKENPKLYTESLGL
jgi:hypothetical protein